VLLAPPLNVEYHKSVLFEEAVAVRTGAVASLHKFRGLATIGTAGVSTTVTRTTAGAASHPLIDAVT
jgi:hypothetical protein